MGEEGSDHGSGLLYGPSGDSTTATQVGYFPRRMMSWRSSIALLARKRTSHRCQVLTLGKQCIRQPTLEDGEDSCLHVILFRDFDQRN